MAEAMFEVVLLDSSKNFQSNLKFVIGEKVSNLPKELLDETRIGNMEKNCSNTCERQNHSKIY